MPRGDKSKYTDKQKRKAEHIADSYESRGVSEEVAEARSLGHREQGVRRRQQVGQRARRSGHEGVEQTRRQEGRSRVRGAQHGGAVGVREEGCRDSQETSRRDVNG